MFEICTLANHSHPTVKLWAEKILKGQLIEYGGDPLLDFGLANFLDRISYKNPKSADKLAKLRNNQRMSVSEKPINEYDFKNDAGEKPLVSRHEEEYLYKYFKEKPEKQKKDMDDEDLEIDEDEEDPELEKFTQKLMEKEMKKLNAGMPIDEEDDELLSELDNQEDDGEAEDSDDQEVSEEVEEGEDFFEGEELSEVDIGQDDEKQEQEEDDEVEMNVD